MPEIAPEIIRLVRIKFRPAGRQYDFNAHQFELSEGDRVIVETDRGRALGIVVTPPEEIPRTETPDDLKSVVRPATEEDLALSSTNAAREKDAFRYCQKRIHERKMEMKLVRAEYLFDGSKIVFYFTADGRVDFRELVKDLAHHFHTRIEMRQIGVRDEAKLTGGIGICGRELCCCTFLTDFAPVSVKMAKEQGLALNPSKISGQCGRLLCCLGYEFDTYCDLKKCLPKCGRRVPLDGREAEVVEQNVLAQKVRVRLEDGKTIEVTAEELSRGKIDSATIRPETGETPRQRTSSGAPDKDQRRPDRKRGPERPAKVQEQKQPATRETATGETVTGERREESSPAAPKPDQAETAPPGDNRPGSRRRRGRRRPRRK